MLVSIGSYAICDGTLSGGVAIGQLRYQVARLIDVVAPIGVANPVLFDRVGRKTTIDFTVQRTHSDAGDAESFIANLDLELPSIGDVKITTTSGGVGYLQSAKVTQHNSQQIGATTTTSYTIVGGQIIIVPIVPTYFELEDSTGHILTETGDNIITE